ncbi:MAG: DUF2298 domain-containing protein [Chloroflexota bacterium]|nr:DUF2298 domain-containing protein [Chloroflexota bacterium]
MNPRRLAENGQHLSYSYGTLLPYVLKGASNLISVAFGEEYANWTAIYRVARPLAALADLLTVACIFLLGRRLFGAGAGLLAAALSALTVLQVQFSHFYVAEPVMTMFLTAALLQIVRALQDRNGRAVLYAGLLLGLAVATKPSAAAFVPAGLVLLTVGAASGPNNRTGSDTPRGWAPRLVRGVRIALFAGIVSVLAWALWEPYAVLDLRTYLANINAESQIQRGIIDVPYTRQYVGTIPGWYHLSQYVRWGAGIPLGLLTAAGLLWGVYRTARRRDWRYALLLAWIAPYTLSILMLEAKWLRYMIPISPALLLMGAALLWHWHETRQRLRNEGRTFSSLHPILIPRLAMGAVLLGSAFWVLAWSRIYTRPHNYIQASEWLYNNVPAGATVGHEHWDDPLPLALPGEDRGVYKYHQIAMYDDLAPEQKLAQVQEAARSSDYIVLATNRLSDSIPRSPWRYAVAIRYYELLFEERLGFREVARFDDGPGLGTLNVPAQGADDNVAVYDHPTTVVFKKERNLEDWEYDALFVDALAAPYSPERHGSVEKSLLLPPRRDAAATGLPYFGGSASTGWTATMAWLLALEVLGLAAWLLLGGLLRALPDRGWTLAKLLGVVLLSWLAWLLPALGLLPAGQGTVWLVAVLLAWSAGIAALVRRRAVSRDARFAWQAMLGFEALFLALFAAGALLRAANPDLWQPYFGGEKPMELAFINGILRSSELPPYDPWFAGGYINYYYFGQWIVASLMRLSMVGPQYGFNLSVATVWALTGTLAAAVGYTVAWRAGRAAAVVVGGISLAFVLLIGNLDGIVQAVEVLRGDRSGPLWQSFDFWRSSRLNIGQPGGFIHEFPFFTFLYGDLHAHMISMPLGLSLLLLGAYVVTYREGVRPRATYLLTGVAGLLVGALAVTNPWDVPTYGGMFGLALGVYWLCNTGRLAALPRLALSGLLLGAVAAAAYLPFFVFFKSFYGEIGVVKDPTGLPVYLNMLGLFLFLAAWYGAARAWMGGRKARLVAAVAGLAGLGIALALDRPVLGLLVTLLGLLLNATWSNRRSAVALTWSGLAAGGLLVWTGIEVLYLKDFLEGSTAYRMNTVFKFGLQSWILLALGCAGLAWLAVTIAHSRLGRALPLALLVVLLSASLVYPVYGTATRLQQRFPEPPRGLTLDGELFLETATLQNVSGMEERYSEDYAAIRWLRENVRRPETIVEASIGPYRGNGGRVSMFTGLPTLVGWDNHEAQQRYPDEVSERHAAIRDLYNSPDTRRALEVIERYGVRYVYVGPVERLHEFGDPARGEPVVRYASARGLAKFDRMVDRTLRVAYRNSGVTVYEVLPSWQWGNMDDISAQVTPGG